ncbi:peptidylprolyl isomerase [uncultured Sphingomonas sp.]|uniref:peptidylprolyl isomerase n=1 Tax=uncultured Sphingomonas sp. TaxID=158754 RepID=UPI0035CCA911
MMIRLAMLLMSSATPLAAQDVPVAPVPAVAPTPAPSPAPAPVALVRVVLTTSEGPITLALEKDRAPITTANFLRYVDSKRLDGIDFYRAMKLAPDNGLIQGGVRDGKLLYPPIKLEPTSKTGLKHVDGTISMARAAPDSARADFFIIVGPMPSLDSQPNQPGDNAGFAAFGQVTEGMEIVRRILAAPTSPTEGEGPMKGQMLAPKIKILTARRAR